MSRAMLIRAHARAKLAKMAAAVPSVEDILGPNWNTPSIITGQPIAPAANAGTVTSGPLSVSAGKPVAPMVASAPKLDSTAIASESDKMRKGAEKVSVAAIKVCAGICKKKRALKKQAASWNEMLTNAPSAMANFQQVSPSTYGLMESMSAKGPLAPFSRPATTPPATAPVSPSLGGTISAVEARNAELERVMASEGR